MQHAIRQHTNQTMKYSNDMEQDSRQQTCISAAETTQPHSVITSDANRFT